MHEAGGKISSARRRVALAVAAVFVGGCGSTAVVASGAQTASATGSATTPTSSGPIDPRAVPLGDGYVSTRPRVGYVDSCLTHFGGPGGARANGPWIHTRTKTWDYRTKLAVNGKIRWPSASYRVTLSGGSRVIAFNDLPIDHTTGVFPIASSDPAYAFDQNGNHIAAQRLDWRLARNPTAAARPGCSGGGPIGVLNDGVVLYNALDGEGRDAGAHEVLDICGGHPDPSENYHHHDIPPCILNRVHNGATVLVGYALDGYGIYVEKNARGVMPTNTQLDACHGKTSRVRWNQRTVRIYHYVATLEYPYTIGCFHGTAISSGHGGGPPGGP